MKYRMRLKQLGGGGGEMVDYSVPGMANKVCA